MKRAREPMTAQEASDMATVLAMPPRPSTPAPMPPASFAVRVKTSMWLRRIVPTPLVINRAARKASMIWRRDAEARRRATEIMEAVVAGTPRAGEVHELARLQLVESTVTEALQWQPWPRPILSPESASRLREHISSDRAVLISVCHVGPLYTGPSALTQLGVVPFTVAGPWFFEPPSHDYWGRRLARWQRSCASRMVLSKGSYPILRALLQRGETVYLFFDMPGSRRTRFLGKPAMLADGTTRLAVETDALVLPLRARRVKYEVEVDVAPPLDPRRIGGVDELQAALAERHEQWILQSPEEMADPSTFDWGHGATPVEWVASSRRNPETGARPQ
jgi:lauroyl/myristoyl acyltransferase